jgi:hypothetical protein
MGLTYTWELVGLKKQNSENFENIVVGTNWKLTGTDEDGNFGVFNGATPFTPQDLNGDGFVDYHDLTEELVLGWVKSVVSGSGDSNYMTHINQQIQKEINNKKYARIEVTTVDLPWSPTSGSSTYPVPSGSVPGY